MDSMGHINNVQYIRFAETSRTNWIRSFGTTHDPAHRQQWHDLLTNKGTGCILKSITCDFKFPMTYPDKISVYHKLRNRPDKRTSSLLLDVLIMSEGKQRPAARLLEDVVIYDYIGRRKCYLEAFMLEVLARTFDMQEQEKVRARVMVKEVDEGVRQLEKESWDREGAKEDFGSAKT
jgi:acyl-CoA thioesterase FadM